MLLCCFIFYTVIEKSVMRNIVFDVALTHSKCRLCLLHLAGCNVVKHLANNPP